MGSSVIRCSNLSKPLVKDTHSMYYQSSSFKVIIKKTHWNL